MENCLKPVGGEDIQCEGKGLKSEGTVHANMRLHVLDLQLDDEDVHHAGEDLDTLDGVLLLCQGDLHPLLVVDGGGGEAGDGETEDVEEDVEGDDDPEVTESLQPAEDGLLAARLPALHPHRDEPVHLLQLEGQRRHVRVEYLAEDAGELVEVFSGIMLH